MPDITIKHIKNVASLEFDIPRGGVHALTGVNGSGKTTLMASLERLRNPFAFQKNYKTSINRQFNSFTNGEVIYSHNGATVSYRYRNSRWAPTPRQGSALLNNFGFNEVIFISSDAERFYVQDNELRTRSIQAANQFYKDSMNELFDTTRFSDLRRLRVEGGRSEIRRSIAFVLPETSPARRQNLYYSEKNFSLGEVLMLNALYGLLNVSNDSLVLIDEIELALHPKVQVRFLFFLRRIAAQKNLTVLISTHSSSLIKSNGKSIYLEREPNGRVNVTYNCFPAVVLKDIAFAEDFHPDALFCVEDDQAEMLWLSMVRFYFRNKPPGTPRPEWKVIPIGGWPNVLKFRSNATGNFIPPSVKLFAILDFDSLGSIQQVRAKAVKSPSEVDLISLVDSSATRTHFLPVTPEVGLMSYYDNLPPGSDTIFHEMFEAGNLHFSQIVAQEHTAQGANRPVNPREASKKWFSFVVTQICTITNWDKGRVQRKLYDQYVLQRYLGNTGQLNGIMGPIFN